MSDVEVDDFLAHFGVRGMRWGQRKVESSDSPKGQKALAKNKKPLTYAQQAERTRKINKAVGIAGVAVAATAIGIMAAEMIIKKNGQIKLEKANLEALKNFHPKEFMPAAFKPQTVNLQKFTPRVFAMPAGPAGAARMKAGAQAASKTLAKAKMDPGLKKFIDNSAVRKAADSSAFKSQAKRQLAAIEADPFILNFMRGKNPEGLARLMSQARG